MVPILNNIGTDVACVGVSHILSPFYLLVYSIVLHLY
jgi:hypothetical protein